MTIQEAIRSRRPFRRKIWCGPYMKFDFWSLGPLDILADDWEIQDRRKGERREGLAGLCADWTNAWTYGPNGPYFDRAMKPQPAQAAAPPPPRKAREWVVRVSDDGFISPDQRMKLGVVYPGVVKVREVLDGE